MTLDTSAVSINQLAEPYCIVDVPHVVLSDPRNPNHFPAALSHPSWLKSPYFSLFLSNLNGHSFDFTARCKHMLGSSCLSLESLLFTFSTLSKQHFKSYQYLLIKHTTKTAAQSLKRNHNRWRGPGLAIHTLCATSNDTDNTDYQPGILGTSNLCLHN